MEYLLRKKKQRRRPARAHLWLGLDTVCRMAGTGGLNVKRYRVSATAEDRPICQMCTNVLEREDAV